MTMMKTTLDYDAGCFECGVALKAGVNVTLVQNPESGKWRAYCEEHAPADEAASEPGPVLADEEPEETPDEEAEVAPEPVAPAPVATAGALACGFCGTDRDLEGSRFASAKHPNRALGQHKRKCPSNPANGGTPAAAATPAVPEAAPVTTLPASTGTTTSAGVLADEPRELDGEAPKPEPTAPAPKIKPAPKFKPPKPDGPFEPMFSKTGLELVNDIVIVFPSPVLLLGPTGMGKSVLVRYATRVIAEALGHEYTYKAVNAHPALDISQIVGFQRPINTPTGIALEWADGALTKQVRDGGAFLFEEATRSPETTSRLFSLLDDGFRDWPTPENPNEDRTDVHPNFWFLATANPTGKGYTTQMMDKALESRFVIFDVREPLADEVGILAAKVGQDVAEKLMRFATDMRKGAETYVSTRDLSLTAQLMVKGMNIKKAVRAAIVEKFSKQADAVNTLFTAHF